jgi:serine phosphatase RsbU (regulator of sigma subunit)
VDSTDDEASVDERLFGALLDESHFAGPDDVVALVARHAGLIGARDVILYLIDYEQETLMPVQAPGVCDRAPLDIETTLAGRAFRMIELLDSETPSGRRVWLPLLDGSDRLGVMELTIAHLDDRLRARCRQLAALAAELVVSKDEYGDAFALTRRRRQVTLASEIQLKLLPPLTFATRRVVISGILQPAYDLGGDSFDYALNADVAHVAMFDAMGHGLDASIMACVTVGCYRHSRRRGLGLQAIVGELDKTIAAQFGDERFVTSVLGQLDCATGRLEWVTAGHPAPLLVRQGRVLGSLHCAPGMPIGLQDGLAEVFEVVLEPGDRLLFYSDGVVEARSLQRQFFGEQRLADFLEKATAAGMPAPETLRRLSQALLRYQQGQLQDDATILFVEWLGATPR